MEGREMVAWSLAFAIRTEAIIGGGRHAPLPGPLVDQIGPGARFWSCHSPGARTLIDVSSVWMTGAAIAWVPIKAASGAAHQAAWPTQSASVARSISMPSRARIADWR